MTYTYDDVITTKDVATGKVRKEDIIGKQGWFEDTLDDALVVAGKGGNPSKVLRDVDTVLFYDNDDSGHYFFLPKKEPEKEYVPFDLGKEEDRAKLREAWIRPKGRPSIGLKIIAMNIDCVFFHGEKGQSPGDLLVGYEFIDGTPCGKLEEEA